MAAALELFVERGFYGTAVPEIAERAGVGAGTIYRYFESKEALVNALYREQKLRFGQRRDSTSIPDRRRRPASSSACCGCGWSRSRSTTRARSSSSSSTITRATSTPRAARSSTACSSCSARSWSAAQARSELKPGDPDVLMGMVMGAIHRCDPRLRRSPSTRSATPTGSWPSSACGRRSAPDLRASLPCKAWPRLNTAL